MPTLVNAPAHRPMSRLALAPQTLVSKPGRNTPRRKASCAVSAAQNGPNLPPPKPPVAPPKAGLGQALRQAAYDATVKSVLHSSYGMLAFTSAVVRCVYERQLLPPGASTTRNVSYVPAGAPASAAQTLDIHSPGGQNLPVVVYMHGGAFVHGSKDTHWMMPIPFMHMGCLVVSINYRLAPKYPFPAALQDACSAMQWVLDNIADYGGDTKRLILAGDSAGGNLAAATCACMCWPRPEPFAKALYERNVTPSAVLPHGATFSMSKFDDYVSSTPKHARIANLLRHINDYYLRPQNERECDITLANPLDLCAQETPPVRPLPPFFIAAGSRDPLLEDSQLAAASLRGAGAKVDTRVYEGGTHVFHALYFTPSRYLKIAVAHWVDTMRFLRKHKLLNPTHNAA